MIDNIKIGSEVIVEGNRFSKDKPKLQIHKGFEAWSSPPPPRSLSGKSFLCNMYSLLNATCPLTYNDLIFQIATEAIDNIATVAALTKENTFAEKYNSHFKDMFK